MLPMLRLKCNWTSQNWQAIYSANQEQKKRTNIRSAITFCLYCGYLLIYKLMFTSYYDYVLMSQMPPKNLLINICRLNN